MCDISNHLSKAGEKGIVDGLMDMTLAEHHSMGGDLDPSVDGINDPFADHLRARKCRLLMEGFRYMMNAMNIRMIKTFAMVSRYYFSAVKHYFADFHILNVNVDKSRYCLSKGSPCNSKEHMCGDRIIRRIRTWANLIQLGLIRVKVVYVRMRKSRYGKHHYKGLTSLLSHISGVHKILLEIHPCIADRLVETIYNLCERSDQNDLLIYVKDSDIDTFPMNARPFFPTYTNRLVFSNEEFPEVRSGQCTKFLYGNDLRQYQRDLTRKRKFTGVTIETLFDEHVDIDLMGPDFWDDDDDLDDRHDFFFGYESTDESDF